MFKFLRKNNAPVITPELIHNHMLNMFSAAENPVQPVPYNKSIVWCRLRRLNQVEIKSCGDFSVISTLQDRINTRDKKLSFHDMSEYSETQHKIIKAAMIQPTYSELMDIIKKDVDVSEKEIDDRLNKVKELFLVLAESKDQNDKKKAKALQEEYAQIEMQYRFRLPADFIGFVMAYALSLDITDIEKLSEEILYNAAVLAKLNHNAPHDNIDGKFVDFMKNDIDNRAWSFYFSKQAEEKEAQKNEPNNIRR